MSDDRPILRVWPRVAAGLPLARLAELPTAVEPLHAVAEAAGAPHADAWIKRDDRTSPHYGGNKVRTLEVLFGRAVADGTERIVSTGAYGSNHSVATLLHAPRVGLTPAVVAFPQPWSTAAADNLRLLLGAGPGRWAWRWPDAPPRGRW